MMSSLIRIFLSVFLIISQITLASDTDGLRDHISNFNREVSEAGSPPCLQCFDFSRYEKTSIPQSTKLKKSIEVSVISLEKAKVVFKTLASNEDIPHEFLIEGCFARTYAMNQMMDEMGIISVKAAVEGDLHVKAGIFGDIRWQYHVAPMVMVKTPKGNVPYVFDPSLFKGPVPFEEWKKFLLKNPKSKYQGEYFTPRFNLHPDDRYATFTKYSEEDQDLVRGYNREYGRMLDLLKMEPKKVKDVMKDIQSSK